MLIPAKLNLYRGQLLSLAKLSKACGVHKNTLSSWQRRFGRVTELRIERHLAEIAEQRRVRELAKAHGLPLAVVRMRRFRGMDADAAATEPLDESQRRVRGSHGG